MWVDAFLACSLLPLFFRHYRFQRNSNLFMQVAVWTSTLPNMLCVVYTSTHYPTISMWATVALVKDTGVMDCSLLVLFTVYCLISVRWFMCAPLGPCSSEGGRHVGSLLQYTRAPLTTCRKLIFISKRFYVHESFFKWKFSFSAHISCSKVFVYEEW